jgi:hypothetical protein
MRDWSAVIVDADDVAVDDATLVAADAEKGLNVSRAIANAALLRRSIRRKYTSG